MLQNNKYADSAFASLDHAEGSRTGGGVQLFLVKAIICALLAIAQEISDLREEIRP